MVVAHMHVLKKSYFQCSSLTSTDNSSTRSIRTRSEQILTENMAVSYGINETIGQINTETIILKALFNNSF